MFQGVFYFIFLTSLLEYNCLTMVCQFLLYNKVNQLNIYIYLHSSSLLHLPPTLPIPPLQVITKHGADLPVLCGCFPLAIYFTLGSVYKSIELSCDPAIPLLGIYPEKTIIQKETCTIMFIAALFTIARTWKQLKFPSTDEWIKKMWHIYTMEYYSAIKRNKMSYLQ